VASTIWLCDASILSQERHIALIIDRNYVHFDPLSGKL